MIIGRIPISSPHPHFFPHFFIHPHFFIPISFTYTYDAASQPTEVNETDSRYTFTYDNVGRVTGISSLASNMPQVALTNVYDAAGNRTSVTDNLATAGTITFTYDAAQRMTKAAMSVGSTLGPEANFSYDAADRLTGMTRRVPPAGQQDRRIESAFGYDNIDRITALTHTYAQNGASNTTLATYTYSYNAASELTGETNADGTYTYTYDNTGQLTSVDASGGTCGATGCDESFSFDVNGNRTITGYTTGTGNRLTSDGTFNYTYDDNGNMLTKTRISDSQKTEFTWDYRNRLTSVVLKNSGGTILQQSDFTYDSFDRRTIESFDDDGPGPHTATVTKTLYDGAGFTANPYADFDGSNTLTMRYLYGPGVDMILARRDASGTVAWYLADHVGSVRDIADTSGTILDHIRYSVFGKVSAETQPANGDRFKFTGREYDADTGLYYYRGRWYSPETGRFMGQDPIGFRAGDGNLYRYVGNSPLIWTDPSGHKRYGPGDWLDTAADYSGHVGSMAAGFIPIVGEAQDWQQAMTGVDLWTGEQLTPWERGLTFAAALVPFVPGSLLRRVSSRAAKFIRKMPNPVPSVRNWAAPAIKHGSDTFQSVRSWAAKTIGCFVAGTPVVMAEQDVDLAVAASTGESEGGWDRCWVWLGFGVITVSLVGYIIEQRLRTRRFRRSTEHPVDAVLEDENFRTLLDPDLENADPDEFVVVPDCQENDPDMPDRKRQFVEV